jgi:hypothetical protein
MLTGGCFCGHVRYEVAGAAFYATNCHCSICRRTSGAPFVAWCSIKPAELRFTRGRPATFRSSDHATRGFCPRCGTQLTFQSTKSPGEIDVTVCSLDDPDAVPPSDHIFASTRVSWIRLADGLPEFASARED